MGDRRQGFSNRQMRWWLGQGRGAVAKAPGPEGNPEVLKNRRFPGRLGTPQCARLLLLILTKIKNCIDRHKQTRPPPLAPSCTTAHCAVRMHAGLSVSLLGDSTPRSAAWAPGRQGSGLLAEKPGPEGPGRQVFSACACPSSLKSLFPVLPLAPLLFSQGGGPDSTLLPETPLLSPSQHPASCPKCKS